VGTTENIWTTEIFRPAVETTERKNVQKNRKRKERKNMKTHKAVMSIIACALAASMIFVSSAQALISPGILKTEGSSTVMPVSLAAETDFENWMLANRSTTVDVQIAGGGSGAGFSRLTSGQIDAGASSRLPKSTEWSGLPNMRIWAIGIDSLAIIVHNETGSYPGSAIKNVTAQQVSDIFCGVYNYWDEVIPGAAHQLIKRAIRVLDSGTHDCFLTFFLTPFGRTNANLAPNCEQFENNIDIYNLLSSEAGKWYIAYIGLGFVHLGHIWPLWLYNSALAKYVQPTKAHVLDGSYPPFRWLWYLTNGMPVDVEVELWITYIKNNTSYIDNEGYITMWRADFTSANPSGDPTAPIHPNLPDNKVDYNDVIYFADAYIAFYKSGTVDPYADINVNHAIEYGDILAFVDDYNAYWNSLH
jgi:phosphate transport system substrate-binding protein